MKHSTILIVDDDAGARDTLEALLSAEDYHLSFAGNGIEALEKAEHLTPSLILLDVMMPGMDGFEVCRRLRAMPLLAEVPILLITALDDRDSCLQGIEAGADDFISKPFDFSKLRARVRTTLRLDRYRRLLQERTKFEWVVQHANDGYLIVNEYDAVIYANFYARLYLGLPDSALDQAETFLTLARRQYRLEPEEAWAIWPQQSPAAAEADPRYLVRPETPTADAFWLQVESLELPAEADTDRILRLHDVTAQVLAQRNRRGFHMMICHKLRTPMVGLLGSLGFMAQHAANLSGKELAEFSEMALKSAQRLHGEIEDILQYLSAPGMGKTGEDFTLTAMQASISRISANLELTAVTVSLPEGLGEAQLMLSPQAFELVFWEILENAKKFHPAQQPTVEISVVRSDAAHVRFKIADDGLALSPEQLAQMWTPYYQGEKYSTGEVKGMGLGLSMVASLVWEVGGACSAYNRPEQPGVVIELVLPLA